MKKNYLILFLNLFFSSLNAQELVIPNEYETYGGHSLGMGGGGALALSDISSVRTNPAMVAFEKQYKVDASYHWPIMGRDFYQLGIIDSKTSAIAAGVNYTGFTDKPKLEYDLASLTEKDSPVHRRIAVALAQPLNYFALGIGGQWLDAYTTPQNYETNEYQDEAKIKGTSINIGVASLLTGNFRFGATAENLANRKIKEFAPLTYRLGGAFVFPDGLITLHGDYLRREKVERFETMHTIDSLGLVAPIQENAQENKNEKSYRESVIFSCSAKIQNLLRVFGAYGRELEKKDDSAAFGVAVVNQQMSLSYAGKKPKLSSADTQQSINLSFMIEM